MNAPLLIPRRPGPLWLLAEVTYRCPLHCAFCYNPVDFTQAGPELSTDAWLSVIRQARALGAAQFGISGGEPLLRDDIEILVAEARQLGFYTNLITSGVGLTEARLAALKAAGLDHIQLSFQDATREANDLITNTRTFDLKRKVAAMTKAAGYPTVINCVLHRSNIDHLDRIIEMAVEIGAEYLELANTQYHGWAFLNRAALMPTAAQLAEAEAVTERWRQRLGKTMRILFVTPDYQIEETQEVHERLGRSLPVRHPRRPRPALPHRAHAAGAGIPRRARAPTRLDLARIPAVQPFSRHRLAAGNLPELRRKRQ
jgi:pyrroloquinoline quinone biosynthesis protein E